MVPVLDACTPGVLAALARPAVMRIPCIPLFVLQDTLRFLAPAVEGALADDLGALRGTLLSALGGPCLPSGRAALGVPWVPTRALVAQLHIAAPVEVRLALSQVLRLIGAVQMASRDAAWCVNPLASQVIGTARELEAVFQQPDLPTELVTIIGLGWDAHFDLHPGVCRQA